MNISVFSKKFYVEANVIKSIDSQHRFIGELFYAAGSNFFSEKVIRKSSDKYWTARSLYEGRRQLTLAMRESFHGRINEDKFVKHFSNRISKTSLIKIANNFGIEGNEIEADFLLKALCRQLQTIISDELSADIVKEEYEKLSNEFRGTKQNQSFSSTLNDETSSILNKYNKEIEKSPVRLWLPDAELATEEQSGFKNFTFTESIKDILNPDKDIWGLSSGKGVGKTYILQKIRRDMTDYAVPYHYKLSKDNEWGIESIRFDNPARLESANILQLAGLWKVSILCLVVSCLEESLEQSEVGTVNFRKQIPQNLADILENIKADPKLTNIINLILIDNTWKNSILPDYTLIKNYCSKLIIECGKNEKNPVVIFIDKVDQSVLQPGAEIPECNNCYKDTKYDQCTENDKKGSAYCLETCRGCCFGCEKYSSPYAGKELRVYGSKYGKRYEHVSQWQYLQLALVLAVDNIRLDFRSVIKIYYTLRQEAFSAEENLFGANAPKIMEHLKVIHYTRQEQEQIFNNTIKIQPPRYLYNPNLIEKGRFAEAFVGISKLCHPYVTGKEETLFECIYRHSFDRAREIQYIGDALARELDNLKGKKSQEEREEYVKEIIECTAADLVFVTSGTSASGNKTYYNDKQILLRNYWANPNNFKNFIQAIDRNLLFMSDLVPICRNVNGCSSCNQKCKTSGCEHHPFSMLYHIGLLGRASYNANINKDSEQHFLDSKNITYYRDEAEIFPNMGTLFILHPALTKCIEKNIRGASIMHFKGFILGKGLMISRDKHRKLIEDKRDMDANSFEAMYYSAPN